MKVTCPHCKKEFSLFGRYSQSLTSTVVKEVLKILRDAPNGIRSNEILSSLESRNHKGFSNKSLRVVLHRVLKQLRKDGKITRTVDDSRQYPPSVYYRLVLDRPKQEREV